MVRITGRQRVRARIDGLAGPEVVQAVGKALFVAGSKIQTYAQQSITAGAVSGKGHVPSLPGEPPNADTHTLDRQIETTQVEPLKVRVSSNAPYSKFLEFGTSRMEARPFMLPALRACRREVTKLVRDAVKRAVRGR